MHRFAPVDLAATTSKEILACRSIFLSPLQNGIHYLRFYYKNFSIPIKSNLTPPPPPPPPLPPSQDTPTRKTPPRLPPPHPTPDPKSTTRTLS